MVCELQTVNPSLSINIIGTYVCQYARYRAFHVRFAASISSTIYTSRRAKRQGRRVEEASPPGVSLSSQEGMPGIAATNQDLQRQGSRWW